MEYVIGMAVVKNTRKGQRCGGGALMHTRAVAQRPRSGESGAARRQRRGNGRLGVRREAGRRTRHEVDHVHLLWGPRDGNVLAVVRRRVL